MQGRFHGRAPVYCTPWHSALVGVVESTISTCARGENGSNYCNPGRKVPLSLALFYGCRQYCLLSPDRTDRLLTTPSSLPSCGRQAGTSVLSPVWLLCRSSPLGDSFGFEHTQRGLHISGFVPRYGLRLVGSQFHLLCTASAMLLLLVLTAVSCLHFLVLVCVSKLGQQVEKHFD